MNERPRTFTSLLGLFFVLSLSLAPFAAAPAIAQEVDEPPELMPADTRTAPSIDPALTAQLAAGPAPVVITTWTRAELSLLGRLGIVGFELRALPMAFATITQAQLDQLRAAPEVRSVWSNEAFSVVQAESTYVVKAREAWTSFGATGKGVELAVIDTGIDGLHADADNLVEFCESQQSATNENVTVFCSPFDPATGNAGPAGATNQARLDSTDDQGHGSHVSGTMAGSGDASGGRASAGSVIGIAPDAKLRVYSSNVGLSLLAFQILSSYDDLIHKKRNGFNQVVAVNNSWGGGTGANYDPNDPIHVAVNEAYKAGILSVFSAGNSGPEHNTLSRQCVNPFVACVAAATKNDQVVMFSSRGRPSQPADTNRDGVGGGAGDVAPDNHDRQLGQALTIGLYRPTLTAPGVAIFSANANAPGCREAAGTNVDCYVALNGTSMSSPHVTGAAGVIAQAFRGAHGRLPTPTELTRILERSANLNKLPGWEAEEQGAGRLNVLEAVRLAREKGKDRGKLVLGYPTPPQLARTASTVTGCTTAYSWSTGIGFGEHTFAVPENAERLRMRLTWNVTGDNVYTQLWRPGVDPGARTQGEGRVFPDQEHANLLHMSNVIAGVGVPLRHRLMDVRAPETGNWTLRVWSRIDDSPEPPCGGTNYSIAVELFTAGPQPSVTISSPANGSTVSGATTISGSATYPAAWDGVTYHGVPGTEIRTALAGTTFFMHGTAHDGYSGDGKADYAAGLPPFLSTEAVGTGTRGSWTTSPFLTLDNTLSPDLPSWKLTLTQPSVVEGPARVSWWASCSACSLGADWIITVWADGASAFSRRVSAPLPASGIPARLTVDVNLPRIEASSDLIVSIDPVFIDAQTVTTLYYDSSEQCELLVSPPSADAPEQSLACDSYVLMPLRANDGVVAPDPPAHLGVTERVGSVAVAWDAVSGATSYEVHRTTDPASTPSRRTRVATTSATSITNAPKPNVTHYYRVIAVAGDARSKPSLLAYGASRKAEEPERLVRVRADRLFGPHYWEFADVSADGTTWTASWNASEVSAGQHTIAARSYSQGVASPGAVVTVIW